MYTVEQLALFISDTVSFQISVLSLVIDIQILSVLDTLISIRQRSVRRDVESTSTLNKIF